MVCKRGRGLVVQRSKDGRAAHAASTQDTRGPANFDQMKMTSADHPASGDNELLSKVFFRA